MRQAFRITRERTVWDRETGQERTTVEVSFGITSLTRTNGNAHDLLRHVRNHWGIENRLHWVRDETFGEDRCRVRGRAAPQVLAAVRNAVISALRLDKVGNIAAAIRDYAWNSQRALAWLGILKE